MVFTTTTRIASEQNLSKSEQSKLASKALAMEIQSTRRIEAEQKADRDAVRRGLTVTKIEQKVRAVTPKRENVPKQVEVKVTPKVESDGLTIQQRSEIKDLGKQGAVSMQGQESIDPNIASRAEIISRTTFVPSVNPQSRTIIQNQQVPRTKVIGETNVPINIQRQTEFAFRESAGQNIRPYSFISAVPKSNVVDTALQNIEERKQNIASERESARVSGKPLKAIGLAGAEFATGVAGGVAGTIAFPLTVLKVLKNPSSLENINLKTTLKGITKAPFGFAGEIAGGLLTTKAASRIATRNSIRNQIFRERPTTEFQGRVSFGEKKISSKRNILLDVDDVGLKATIPSKEFEREIITRPTPAVVTTRRTADGLTDFTVSTGKGIQTTTTTSKVKYFPFGSEDVTAVTRIRGGTTTVKILGSDFRTIDMFKTKTTGQGVLFLELTNEAKQSFSFTEKKGLSEVKLTELETTARQGKILGFQESSVISKENVKRTIELKSDSFSRTFDKLQVVDLDSNLVKQTQILKDTKRFPTSLEFVDEPVDYLKSKITETNTKRTVEFAPITDSRQEIRSSLTFRGTKLSVEELRRRETIRLIAESYYGGNIFGVIPQTKQTTVRVTRQAVGSPVIISVPINLDSIALNKGSAVFIPRLSSTEGTYTNLVDSKRSVSLVSAQNQQGFISSTTRSLTNKVDNERLLKKLSVQEQKQSSVQSTTQKQLSEQKKIFSTVRINRQVQKTEKVQEQTKETVKIQEFDKIIKPRPPTPNKIERVFVPSQIPTEGKPIIFPLFTFNNFPKQKTMKSKINKTKIKLIRTPSLEAVAGNIKEKKRKNELLTGLELRPIVI